MAPPRAVLFDLDGTLLDTAPDMAGALNALLSEHGRAPLPYAAVRPWVSHGSAHLVRLGFADADACAIADLQQRFLVIYGGALSRETRLFDGMEHVLDVVAERGLACGIVTNKPGALTGALLDELGLAHRFDCVVSGDTLSERKPHALPMLHAARLAGVAAAHCIYVGDAERDVQAAHAAGMPCLVAVYGYLSPDTDWRTWNGDGAVQHPLDLLAWLGPGGNVC